MIDYTYKDLFLQDSVDKQLKIEVEDGTVITNEDIWMESMSLDESLCSEESLTFGSCEASQFKIQIANRFSPMIDMWITVTVTLDGHTDDPFLIGKFKVQSDKPTADRTYREITAYDSMYDIIEADKGLVADWYEELLPEESSTVTMREFRDSFIALFGLEVIDTNLCNDTMTVEKTVSGTELSGQYILESICEINGCFGHITRDGKFQFITLGEIVDGDITYILAADDDSYLGNVQYGYTETAILGKAVTGYAVLGNSDDSESEDDEKTAIEIYGEDYGQKTTELEKTYEISCTYEDFETQKINKLQVREEDRDIGAIIGTGDNCYVIENNLFAYGKNAGDLEKIAQAIYNVVSVISYRPATINAKGNPCYEIGDAIKLETKYETIYTLVLKRSLTGIQNLRDQYEADGTEKYADNSVGLNASMEQLKGQTNTLIRNVDENTVQISNIHGDISEIRMTIDSITLTVSSQTQESQYDFLGCQDFAEGKLPEDWKEYHNIYGTFEYLTEGGSTTSGLPLGWETYIQYANNSGTTQIISDGRLGTYCVVEKTDSNSGSFGIRRRVPITGTWDGDDLSGTLSIKCKIAKIDSEQLDNTVNLGFTKGSNSYSSSYTCSTTDWREIEYTRSSTTLASGEYIYIDISLDTEGSFLVTDITATLDGITLVSENFSGSGTSSYGSCVKITKTREGTSDEIYPLLIYDLGVLPGGDYRVRFKAMTDEGYEDTATVRYGVYPSENEEEGVFNTYKGLSSTAWTTVDTVITVETWDDSTYFSIGAYEIDAPVYITDIEFLYPATTTNTGALGGTASIVLSIDGSEQIYDLDFSNVRESFANDTSSVVISAGTILFLAGTLLMDSDNFVLQEDGSIIAENGIFSGTLIARGDDYEMIMAESSLIIYYQDEMFGEIVPTISNGVPAYMSIIGSSSICEAITLGFENNTYLYINNNANPNGYSQKIQLAGTTVITGATTITASLTTANILHTSYGISERWTMTWGVCGIASLSSGASLSLYAQDDGSSSWTSSITIIDSSGVVNLVPKTGGTFTGALTVQGRITINTTNTSGIYYTQTSSSENTAASIDIVQQWSEKHISLQCGTGGTNRGVYDNTTSNWIIYRDDSYVRIPTATYLSSTLRVSSTTRLDGTLNAYGTINVRGYMAFYEDDDCRAGIRAVHAMSSNNPIISAFETDVDDDESMIFLGGRNMNRDVSDSIKFKIYFVASTTADYSVYSQSTYFSGSIYCGGSFSCRSSKNRIVETEHYGDLCMNCLETASALFEDVGSGVMGEDGQVTIYFDPEFTEVIDLDADYQVFLTKTSKGEINYAEKEYGFFVVYGDAGTSFDWRICAHQRDYTSFRFEEYQVVLEDNKSINAESIYSLKEGRVV